MSNDTSSTYPPHLPRGVEAIAWLTLVGSVVLGIIPIVLVHTVHNGDVLFTNEITGHPYVASGWFSRLVTVLLITAVCALGALAALHTLKGRMWGYYVILATLVWSIVSPLLRAPTGRGQLGIDIMGILILLLFLSGFKGFREFARYQAHTPHPDRA